MELPDISNPPPQSFYQDENKIFSKKNIITFLVIGIGLLIVPFSVKLVQEQQLFRSRAAGEAVTFTGPDVSCDTDGKNCTTKNNVVSVELRSPLGSPGVPVASSSASSSPSPTQSPTPISSRRSEWYGSDSFVTGSKLTTSFFRKGSTSVLNRSCSITASGVNWGGCTFSPYNLNNVPELTGSEWYSSDSSIYNGSLHQAFYKTDGHTIRSRTCPVSDSGVDWSRCEWSKQPNNSLDYDLYNDADNF